MSVFITFFVQLNIRYGHTSRVASALVQWALTIGMRAVRKVFAVEFFFPLPTPFFYLNILFFLHFGWHMALKWGKETVFHMLALLLVLLKFLAIGQP